MTRLIRPASILLLTLLVLALAAPAAVSGKGAGEIILKFEAPECVKRVVAYSYLKERPLECRFEDGSCIITPSEVGESIEVAVEIDEQRCYMRGFKDEVRLLEYQGTRLMINAANYTMIFTVHVKKFKTVYVTVTSDPPYCINLVRSDMVNKEDGKWLVGPLKVGDQPAYFWLEVIPSDNCTFSSWSLTPLTSKNPYSTLVDGYIDENVTLTAIFRPIAPQTIEEMEGGKAEGGAPPPATITLINLLRDNYPLLITLAIVAGVGVAIPKTVKLLKRRRKRRIDWFNATLQHLEREADARAPWIGIFTKKIAFKTFSLEELVEGLEQLETASEHHALMIHRPSSVASLHYYLTNLIGGSYAMVADKMVAGLCAYYGIAPFTREFAAGARARAEEVVRGYRSGSISLFEAVNMLYQFLAKWASSDVTFRVHEKLSNSFTLRHGRLPKIADWVDDIMSLCINMLRATRVVTPAVTSTPKTHELAEGVKGVERLEAPKAPAKPPEAPEPIRRRVMEYAATNLFCNPFKEDEELEGLAAKLCREMGTDTPVSEVKNLLKEAIYELRAKILEGRVEDLDQLPIPREVLDLESDEIMLYVEGCNPVKLYKAAAEVAISPEPEKVASEKVNEVIYEGVHPTDDLRQRIEAALIRIAERIKERGGVGEGQAVIGVEEKAVETVTEEYKPQRLEVRWVEEGEIGRLCPLCGEELSKSMEGLICRSCDIIYKIKKVPIANVEEEEAWVLKIPEEVVKDPGVKVVVLKDYPYNLPATFTIKCEGFEATVYREPAKRGMRAEEFVENLIKSIERDAQTGRCSIIVVTRPGTDPWSRKTIYLERVVSLTSTLAHLPPLLKKLKLIIVVPEETIFLKDAIGELRRRLKEANVEFKEYVVELPYEEILENAKKASITNPEQIVHLLRAFPKILRHLRRGKTLPEAIKIELASEGEDVQYIINAVEKFHRLGGRLTEEEVKEVVGLGGVAWVKLQTLKALDLVG